MSISLLRLKEYRFRKKGFTLVEIVIYVFFVAIVSIIALRAVHLMTVTFSNLRVARDINNSAAVSLERIVNEIRSGVTIDQVQSVLGVNASDLYINAVDSLGAPVVTRIYLSGGRISVDKDGVYTGPLTSKNITVDTLSFSLIDTGNTIAVKTVAQITGERKGVSKTKVFYTTTTLRGSY